MQMFNQVISYLNPAFLGLNYEFSVEKKICQLKNNNNNKLVVFSNPYDQ